MQVILLCMFLQFKLYLAEMVDMVVFTCFAVDHVRWDDFSVSYAY